MCQNHPETTLLPPHPPTGNPNLAEKSRSHPYYLDNIDKPYNGHKARKTNKSLSGVYACHTGWIKGECSGGHSYAKAVMCDKEWCPDCGKKHSNIHERRITRWWSPIMSMQIVGQLVIPIPEQFREDFYNRDLLRAFRKYITRKLKGDGFKRGLSKWHWAGKCTHCKEKGCEKCKKTGMSDVWKPHLNILIENGYEPFLKDNDNWINRYKDDIAFQMCKLINQYRKNEKAKQHAKDLNCEFEDINLSKVKLDDNEIANVDSIVLHYSYTDKPEKKIHYNTYITRATWRYDNNFKVISTIKGFRTTSWWGKHPKTHERTSELAFLEKGCCPECDSNKIKSEIKWGCFESAKNAGFDYRYIKKIIGAGYYLLDLPPPDIVTEDFEDVYYTNESSPDGLKGDYIVNN